MTSKATMGLLAVLVMLLSVEVHATGNLTGPTSDADGNYTLSWTGNCWDSDVFTLYENSTQVYSSCGDWTYNATGKSAGTYHYQLEHCAFYYPEPGWLCAYADLGTYEGEHTVEVTGGDDPPTTCSVSFTIDDSEQTEVDVTPLVDSSTATSYEVTYPMVDVKTELFQNVGSYPFWDGHQWGAPTNTRTVFCHPQNDYAACKTTSGQPGAHCFTATTEVRRDSDNGLICSGTSSGFCIAHPDF